MSYETLPTNLVDDVLNSEVNTQRRFVIKDTATGNIINADVVIEEITTLTTRGSEMGSNLTNKQNRIINQHSEDLTDKILLKGIEYLTCTGIQSGEWTNKSYTCHVPNGTTNAIPILSDAAPYTSTQAMGSRNLAVNIASQTVDIQIRNIENFHITILYY